MYKKRNFSLALHIKKNLTDITELSLYISYNFLVYLSYSNTSAYIAILNDLIMLVNIFTKIQFIINCCLNLIQRI